MKLVFVTLKGDFVKNFSLFEKGKILCGHYLFEVAQQLHATIWVRGSTCELRGTYGTLYLDADCMV